MSSAQLPDSDAEWLKTSEGSGQDAAPYWTNGCIGLLTMDAAITEVSYKWPVPKA